MNAYAQAAALVSTLLGKIRAAQALLDAYEGCTAARRVGAGGAERTARSFRTNSLILPNSRPQRAAAARRGAAQGPRRHPGLKGAGAPFFASERDF